MEGWGGGWVISLGDIPVWVFFGERCLWRCYPVFWVMCCLFLEAVLLVGEGMMGGFLVKRGGGGLFLLVGL